MRNPSIIQIVTITQIVTPSFASRKCDYNERGQFIIDKSFKIGTLKNIQKCCRSRYSHENFNFAFSENQTENEIAAIFIPSF